MGNVWGNIFGFSFISMRVLTLLFLIICAILAVVPVYLEKRDVALSIIFFDIILILRNQNIWGYDMPSRMFWMMCLIAFWLYYRYRKNWWLVALGIFMTLAIFTRMPNVVLLPISAILFMVVNWKRVSLGQTLLQITLVLGVTAVTSYIVLVIFYGSPSNYLAAYHEVITFDQGHSVTRLLTKYIFATIEFLPRFLAILGLALMYRYLCKYSELSGKRVAQLWAWGITVFVTFFVCWTHKDSNNFYRQDVLLALLLSIMCAAAYYAALTKQAQSAWQFIAIIFLFALVPMAGSDTGLLKVGSYLLVPFVYLLGVKYCTPRVIKFMWAVLAAFIIFAPLHRVKFLYEDQGLQFVNTLAGNPSLNVITTPERAALISEMSEIIAQNSKILPVGTSQRFIFEYLQGTRVKYARNFFHSDLNNQKYVDYTKSDIEQNAYPTVVVIDGYPEDEIDPTLEDNLMEQMLTDKHYSLIKAGPHFRVYQNLDMQ